MCTLFGILPCSHLLCYASAPVSQWWAIVLTDPDPDDIMAVENTIPIFTHIFLIL